MSLKLNWVGEEAYDRVALTRLRCYAPASSKYDRFDQSVKLDRRQRPGDFLLATRDGVDVGTSTALSLKMWIRGARFDCQGVAYVGTIKTHRRGGSDGERGIASQLMDATIHKAREREQPLTALMPFRASFYEHFGYGNAEHRVEWTVPLALLPRGEFGGYRFYEKSDDAKLIALRGAEASRGQCDVETDAPALANYQRTWPDGMTFVDQPTVGGEIEAYLHVLEERTPTLGGTATLNVEDWGATSPAAFLRMLHMLASLKDQYTFARLTLPGDLPLNRLLRESQVPHRQVDHPVATARPYTRMQVRVLDHRKVLEAVTLATPASGKLTVAIRESEGETARLTLDLNAGRIVAKPATTEANVMMSDVLWASIVTGDLAATTARSLGLIKSSSDAAITLLDAFAAGRTPFCQEYF